MAPVYWLLARLHRFGVRITAARGPGPALPMVVVGALRAGGSGKTSVTAAMAAALRERGCRPAILVYRLGRGPAPDPVLEVGEEDDWRESSEEAVLLRRATGCRVFATRDRASAWRRLQGEDIQSAGAFDVVISDDGFQDPRLEGAFHILLAAPQERPGLFDLLPAGPFRETWSARLRADLLLRGPFPSLPTAPSPRPPEVTSMLPYGPAAAPEAVEGVKRAYGPPEHRFERSIALPAGVDPGLAWIAYCALGDNLPFLLDLERAGLRPAAVVEGRDHGTPPLRLLRECAARWRAAGIICTRKDYLKLGPEVAGPAFQGPGGLGPDSVFAVLAVEQSITLDPETVAAVDAYRLAFRNRYLVHYPA
ncbi:MAG: tetraacyldisaccharide 4'-kinase [Fibrobacteria bacterium]